MYPDTVLFIVAFVFAAVLVFLVVYLLSSRRRGRFYTEVLRQESERFDAITATLFSASSQLSGGQTPAPWAAGGAGGGERRAANGRPYGDAGVFGGGVGTETVGLHGGTERLIATGDGGWADMKSAPTGDGGFDGGAVTEDIRGGQGFDAFAVSEAYVVEREIGGGAMSRTFQVRSLKLGNPWFMKFIPSGYGGLANEVDILKFLNHASLPKIVDVFHRDEGVYIIETLVEGVPLDKFNKTGAKVSQYILLDWFEQAALALNYLHGMQPSPIFHLDLKPGNIMVTHDNRLVLVDFGIARRYGDNSPGAVTAAYAAPEQFGGRMLDKYGQLFQERFGGVPSQAFQSVVDGRADIYSLGVIMFELATGMLPALKNMGALKQSLSDELGAIIQKCLSVNPVDRYRSVDRLLDDLRKVKGTKLKMARLLFTRRLAAAAASVSLLVSGGSFAGGYYIYNEESAAVVAVQPETVTISLQQSSDYSVRKQMADGRVVFLNEEQIEWEYSDDNIARISGGRVSGINEGKTVIRGFYRNKEISLTVRVVRPVDGLVDVSQRYEPGRSVRLFAGGEGRTRVDGPLGFANFISPESITVADDGTIYVTDASEIRVISGGEVGSVVIPVDYVKAAMVRCFDNELYLLSEPWQDGDRYFYTLARLGAGLESLYIADAVFTAVEDFGFGFDGLLYFIDRNEGLGGVFLKTLDLYDVRDIRTLCSLPAGSDSLAVAGDGCVYVGNSGSGVIQVFRDGELEYFAGIEGERAFIDGASPRFYSPQRLEHRSGYLYVWDFNTLRRIEAVRGVAGDCITIAGLASPDFDMEFDDRRVASEDVVLPFGSLMDFAVAGRGVLITDPKRGVIWEAGL